MVAAFLLINKVYSPQYVLWLLPLVALARPRLRDWLIWQAGRGDPLRRHLAADRRLPAGQRSRALGEDGYGVTVLAHIAGTLWLMAMVVRDILRPEPDPVRRDGSDDPGGGVLDRAPDAFASRLTLARRRTPRPGRRHRVTAVDARARRWGLVAPASCPGSLLPSGHVATMRGRSRACGRPRRGTVGQLRSIVRCHGAVLHPSLTGPDGTRRSAACFTGRRRLDAHGTRSATCSG